MQLMSSKPARMQANRALGPLRFTNLAALNKSHIRRRCTSAKAAGPSPLRPFGVEQYQGWYTAPHVLSHSDCESLSMAEVLAMADTECHELWSDLSLGYPFHVQGHPLLVAEIAARHAVRVNVNVLAPQEGIFIAAHALLQAGDQLIVTTPGYQSLWEVARSIGCDVKRWEVDHTSNGFTFDPDKLEALLEQRHSGGRTLVVVNFPHNPTGALPEQDEFARIVELCERSGAYLFSDEMYRGLEHDPSTTLPPAADCYERAISLGGMSKSLSMPGLRIGWLASQCENTMTRVQQIKDFTTICPSAPAEILATIGLRSQQQILDRNLKIIADGKQATEQFFDRHTDLFEWTPPKAGPFAFPALANPSVSSKEFCDTIAEDAGVMLLPSELFEYGDNRFRICYGRADTPSLLRVWEGRCF